MKVRVADFIAQTLAKHGVRHVFLVTGGGAMHLNDAFGRNKELQYVACHHEQACAIAAEGYARIAGRMAAVNVTTGPGGTNAITGVWGAYTDSVPMIVISGQVQYRTVVRSTDLPLRQLGDQEIDITRMVESCTKYAQMVTDAEKIKEELERAIHIATTGRPGPVWLDIPMNIQGALIDPDTLKGFDAPKMEAATPVVDDLMARIAKAERPILLVGQGIRASGAHEKFLKFAEKLGIPIAVSFNALDVVWDDHPLFVGRQGTIGDRGGNFAVQNSDLVLILGARMNIRQISYNYENFARSAFKVMVDIDEAELKKPTLKIDLPIHADLNAFFDRALTTSYTKQPAHEKWVEWCMARRKRYPVVLPEYWNTKDAINPYCFMETLFGLLPENSIVVSGDGTASVTSFQAAALKKGSRLFHNSGSAPMGFDLPAAVGAAIAAKGRNVICLAGDGSIQMNLQELQTISTHDLPVKVFVLNNRGYHSIRQTQQNYFADNIVGCGTESGLGFPAMDKIASAYDMPYSKANTHADMKGVIEKVLASKGRAICEIMLDLNQVFAPKLSSRKLDDGRMISSPLEDLAPFLSREELAENMIVPMLPQ